MCHLSVSPVPKSGKAVHLPQSNSTPPVKNCNSFRTNLVSFTLEVPIPQTSISTGTFLPLLTLKLLQSKTEVFDCRRRRNSLNSWTILNQKIGHSDCLTSSKLRRSWRLNRVAWLMWFFSCVIRSERTTPFLCEKKYLKI